jgi:hypothetical protein
MIQFYLKQQQQQQKKKPQNSAYCPKFSHCGGSLLMNWFTDYRKALKHV